MENGNAASEPHALAVEANHRIANNLLALLSAVSRQVRAMHGRPELISRAEAIGALSDIQGKILAMARLHQALAAMPSEGQIDLGKVLTELAHDLTSVLYGRRLHIVCPPGLGCLVTTSQASMLMLVFSEIVTNAIKYAHPSGLPVELSVSNIRLPDGNLLLQVSDDGVGLPEGFEETRDAGVGLTLIRSLIERAGGQLEIHSSPLGLTFSILTPS